ncbi:MAG: YdeI/OmpD-associated family protein, partial [Tsuneonella sp.]
GMAAFKAHCAFTIHGEGRGGSEGMGQHGKLTAMADLPPDELLSAKIRAAAERIASEGSAARRPSKPKTKAEIAMPDDFAAALSADPKARAAFEGFPPGARREYLEWITEAKRPETRAKRIAQAAEWLAEGKKRNWKYENC